MLVRQSELANKDANMSCYLSFMSDTSEWYYIPHNYLILHDGLGSVKLNESHGLILNEVRFRSSGSVPVFPDAMNGVIEGFTQSADNPLHDECAEARRRHVLCRLPSRGALESVCRTVLKFKLADVDEEARDHDGRQTVSCVGQQTVQAKEK